MGKKPLDRWWIGILISMLLAEVVLLSLHFLWNGFTPKKSLVSKTPIAGSVLTNKNELHRRSLNSLIWEKSNTNDPLYFYDSILTLAQSSASLKLFKDTQIQLSENTLMTIEPADNKEYGEITLKVHKGGLKARNPNAPAQIESDTWTMSIRTGSEIDLRQTNDSEYELSVKNGEVKFNNQETSTAVKPNEVLRINNEKIERLSIDTRQEFQWVEKPPARIYSHQKSTDVNVSWKSLEADQLVLQSLGKPERLISLQPGEAAKSLSLPYGQHRLYLRKAQITSEPIEFEILTAPIVHLLNPLPRDRGKMNSDLEFKWLPVSEASKYEIQMLTGQIIDQQVIDTSQIKKHFSLEADVEWSVWAIDQDGYKIPPPYKYPLYIREEPLAPPKLYDPTLRAPAQEKPKANAKPKKSASFWWHLKQLLIPMAQAEELLQPQSTYYQIELKWEKIPSADHYVIEISETSDFRNPVLTQKVLRPEFLWNQAELKAYHWRVAAGSKSGRLGIFSEPKLMDLENKPPQPLIETKVDTKNIKPTAAAAKSDDAEKPVKLVEPQPIKETPPAYKASERLRFEWRPLTHYYEAKAEQNVSAKLSGINLLSVGVLTEQKYYDSHIARIEFTLSRISLKPTPQENFPFQKNLEWNEYAISSMLHKTGSPVGYGATLRHSAQIKRAGLETVKVQSSYLIGPGFEYTYQTQHNELISSVYALFGTQNGVQLSEQWRIKTGPNGIMGLGLDFTALFKGSETSFGARLNLGIGFGF